MIRMQRAAGRAETRWRNGGTVTLLARDLAYELHAQALAELQSEDGEVTLVAYAARCILIELTSASP